MKRDHPESRVRVFDWAHYTEWYHMVMDIVVQIWGKDVINTFQQEPPKNIFVGSWKWIRPYLGTGTNTLTDDQLSKTLTDALKEEWTHIRAFHGCNIANIASYYTVGIRPLNLEKTNEWARHYFINVCHRLSNESISRAIERVGRNYNAKDDEKVFLAIDCSHLLQHCAHYMLYGSEYLLTLAAELKPEDRKGEACDFRRFLKDQGIPTVIVCDVPLCRMEHSVFVELGQVLLAETFRGLVDPNHTPLSRRFGFPISGTLKPEHIVAHINPDCLHDPLEPFLRAISPSKSCFRCHQLYAH